MELHELLARGVAASGAPVFTLPGDANLSWLADMESAGVGLVAARTEGGALAMADGWARASGRVGVCSVTSGPGMTQIATSLVAAVRQRTPLVVLAGDTPAARPGAAQALDQAGLVAATGARFVAVHDPATAPRLLRAAWADAAARRVPVVVSIPTDVQTLRVPDTATLELDGDTGPAGSPQPDRGAVAEAAARLRRSRRPVVVAGRGAVDAGAREAVVALAARVGALLTTTLPAKDWFLGEPFDAGICGGFAPGGIRALLGRADCVVAVGASLDDMTTDAGALFPQAEVVWIDLVPGRRGGWPTTCVAVAGDADQAVAALEAKLAATGHRDAGYRSPEVEREIRLGRSVQHHGEAEEGRLDPAAVVRELDGVLPASWPVVVGVGHYWNFVVLGLRRPQPGSFIPASGFAVAGQALPTGIGAAVAHPEVPTVIIEGDGGLLMNVQELDALGALGLPVLMIVMNDAAYGAEVHKLRSLGLDDGMATLPPRSFAQVARAFGVEAETVTSQGHLAQLVRRFGAERGPLLIDALISREVVAERYGRIFGLRPAHQSTSRFASGV